MNELKLKLPWWYKPFVRFMPEFFERVPEFKLGDYRIRVDELTRSYLYPIK